MDGVGDGAGEQARRSVGEQRQAALRRLTAATEAIYRHAAEHAETVLRAAEAVVEAHRSAGVDAGVDAAGLETMARAVTGLPAQPVRNTRFAAQDVVVALVRAMAAHPGRPGSLVGEFRAAVAAAAAPPVGRDPERGHGLVPQERICQITGLTVAAVREIAGEVKGFPPGGGGC